MEVELKALLDDLDVLEKSLSDPAPIHKVIIYSKSVSFVSWIMFLLSYIRKELNFSHALVFNCLRVILVLIWIWILLKAFIFMAKCESFCCCCCIVLMFLMNHTAAITC